MPELPEPKTARFLSEYGITPYDAGVLTATRALADYFEAVVRSGAPPKAAANWISVELLRRLKDAANISDCPVTPSALAELLRTIEKGEITAASGKKVFQTMFDTGKRPADVITAERFQIMDISAIEQIARDLIRRNPENVAKYRSGNEGVFKFFVGQVMRETRGQANPQAVNEILRRLLTE